MSGRPTLFLSALQHADLYRFCQSATAQAQCTVYRLTQLLFKLAAMLPAQPCLQSLPHPAEGTHISEEVLPSSGDYNKRGERLPTHGRPLAVYCRDQAPEIPTRFLLLFPAPKSPIKTKQNTDELGTASYLE